MPEGFESDDTVPLLLNLCLGPDGPLREITTAGAACLPLPSADMAMCLSGLDSAAPQPTSKKKGKAKKKKRKATKLEAGMADAQTHASGCLRILSLNASGQCAIARHGGIRYLAPLLSSNIQQARWNARQVTNGAQMVNSAVDAVSVLGAAVARERSGLCAGNGEIPFAEVHNEEDAVDAVFTVAPPDGRGDGV